MSLRTVFMRPYVAAIMVIVVGGFVVRWAAPGEDNEAYVADIMEQRRQKNEFLREDPDSPLRDVAGFDTLAYFPVHKEFRVRANLIPIEKKQVRVLSTSTGEQVKYLEYAWARFPLGRDANQLLILEVMDMGPNRGKLFLAFADETSARETYGGGRYLDLKKVPAATSIELDFNKAYNPYCAYNANYSCPLPPGENILKVPILAGEKSYKH